MWSTTSDRRNAVLIAGQSGRALAQAAVRAGYAPLVADLFADGDTREAAVDTREAGSLNTHDLLPALQALAADRAPIGLVLGSGFEDRAPLIAALGERFPIIGNDATTVDHVKDSVAFAAACVSLGLPHPAIRLGPPGEAGWLAKQEGGSGGFHVRPAAPDAAPAPGWYVQQTVAGDPVGVLFVADGRSARLLAVTDQWADPAPDKPFRFGGAVWPSATSAAIQTGLAEAAHLLAGAFRLRGLNSLDALASEDGFTVLEVNPRPSATIDLFPEWNVFAWHLASCGGNLPPAPAAPAGARAMALAYASRSIVFEDAIAWPEWTADRMRRGNRIAAGEPFCSVHAKAATAGEARALAKERVAEITAAVERL
jgi:uncharacterized protein